MYKTIITAIICLLSFSTINAQIYVAFLKTIEMEKHHIFLSKAKFKAQIGDFTQVITPDNQLMYFDRDGNEVAKDKVYFNTFICGTVPNYTLKITKSNSMFYVEQSDGHFGMQVEPNSTRIDSVSVDEVDDLLFMNGKKEFFFTANYGMVSTASINPKTLIFQKDGKYGVFREDATATYDDFSFDRELLKVQQGNLVGFYGIQKRPKYQELSDFTFFLARFTAADGRKGYVDNKGNEYFDN